MTMTSPAMAGLSENYHQQESERTVRETQAPQRCVALRNRAQYKGNTTGEDYLVEGNNLTIISYANPEVNNGNPCHVRVVTLGQFYPNWNDARVGLEWKVEGNQVVRYDNQYVATWNLNYDRTRPLPPIRRLIAANAK
jgi:hypothetical protein